MSAIDTRTGPERTALLETRELSKVFHARRRGGGSVAVHPTTLRLEQGRCLGIVGESGSGKTTLARMICGLTVPTSGQVDFAGTPVRPRHAAATLRGRVQMVFQDPYDSLNPRLRVLTSIQEPMLLSGRYTADAARDRAGQLLRRVQLDESFGHRFPGQLSGGQLQRVSIARALASGPQLIVLDEPTSALDWMTRGEIIDLLNELRRDLDVSYLFISHDIGAVAAVSDEIAVMYFGSVVESGPAEQVLRAPAHPYTRTLLSAVLQPRVGSRVRAEAQPPPHPRSEAASGGCAFVPRCPDSVAECADTPQRLLPHDDARSVACMRVTDKPEGPADEPEGPADE
ncbi:MULTISPECIES: ABC transporter ATP-binding protein [unclassified Streptomyces]|uniref:ABC transporter ATP-binding protein n=1 Tax=unclassified Streptomyces TaxID=2593676 RepID=UPI002E28339C|nr:oligopeptide/dipeptide ABC transporter ATP-binding protein [Streptomyces sp. NBC_00223]